MAYKDKMDLKHDLLFDFFSVTFNTFDCRLLITSKTPESREAVHVLTQCLNAVMD